MQTFLPHPDFEQSARSLDQKRLGKQRVECIQVVRGLTWEKYGWKNHPAVKMWRGYEEALGRYSLVCCEVWVELGYADTCAGTIRADLAKAGVTDIRSQAELAAAGGRTGHHAGGNAHHGQRQNHHHGCPVAAEEALR